MVAGAIIDSPMHLGDLANGYAWLTEQTLISNG